MKRILLVAALGMLMLSGCVPFNRFFNIASDQTPVVVVANGVVTSVNPEPLRFSKEQGRVTIYWQAPTGYRFSSRNGIVVEGERIGGPGGKLIPQNEVVECQPTNSAFTEFSCVNRNSKEGTFKYTVNVETVDGKALKPFDPTIINGSRM